MTDEMAAALEQFLDPGPALDEVEERPRLRVVGPPGRRRSGWPRRRVVVVATTLIVGSLLVVAGAQAYMTQEQVRLGTVQSRLASDIGEHRILELRLAQLSNPSHIVGVAQQRGLTVPNTIEDVPATTTPDPPPSHGRRGTSSRSSPASPSGSRPAASSPAR
jgi:hypothetical protein